MGLIRRSDEPWGESNRELQRARTTTGYDFVSRQRDEMQAERDTAREQLRGAVEALRKVSRLLDRSTQTGKAPTQDEWEALALANATLDRFGGQ